MSTTQAFDPAYDQPVTHGRLQQELEAVRAHAQQLVDNISSAFRAITDKFALHEQCLQSHVAAFQQIAVWQPQAEQQIVDTNT